MLYGCTSEEQKDTTGSIYGVITDKATGEPVNAASIELGLGYPSIGFYRYIATLRRTVSGSDGQYEFKDIEPDLSEYDKKYSTKVYYYVMVSKEGYKNQFYQLKVEPGKIANGDVLLEPLK
jgi:hypothetical protein